MHRILIACALLTAMLSVDSPAQDPGVIDDPSNPPLHEAIRAGDVAAIQSLLEAGADPNAVVNCEGKTITPLWLALESQPDDLAGVVRLLLDAGADPNLKASRPGEEGTPLMGALETLAVAQLLLDAGADPNMGVESDLAGHMFFLTPLTIALSEVDIDAVRLLLRAGADPNLSSVTFGAVQTPLSYPVFGLQSIAAQGVELVSLLLEAGADPNAPFQELGGETDLTPLLMAVSEADVSAMVVRLLLDAGANPNSGEQMIEGQWVSPLSIALEAGNSDVALLLREAGAKEAPEGAEDLGPPHEIGRHEVQLTVSEVMVDAVQSVPWGEPIPRVWMKEGREVALAAAAHGYQPVRVARQAFGDFGMERFEQHWQGIWLLGEAAVWHVEGSKITVHRPGSEPSVSLFEVESPCAVARVWLSMGDDGSSSSRTRFLIDGERTYVTGSGGFITELEGGTPAVVVCHFGGTTTLIGDRCTNWDSGRSGSSGGELRFTQLERSCGIEHAPGSAVETRRFHYEDGNFRTRKTIPIEGRLLKDEVTDALVEASRYDSLDEALAELNDRHSAAVSDRRDMPTVATAIREMLLDPERGGMADEPWISIDTEGRYTDVQIAGCTLSTTLETRMFGSEPTPLRVRTVIPLGEIVSRPRVISWIAREGEIAGTIGAAIVLGQDEIGRVEECRDAADGSGWQCEPLADGVIAVIVRTRSAANALAADLARAGELCGEVTGEPAGDEVARE